MKQITIYKVVDVNLELPENDFGVPIIYNTGIGIASYYKEMKSWSVEQNKHSYITAWLKPTTYIEIEGALYESIEKVHGESFEAGEMWEYSNWKVGNLNKPNKSDFLKEKTK